MQYFTVVGLQRKKVGHHCTALYNIENHINDNTFNYRLVILLLGEHKCSFHQKYFVENMHLLKALML